MSMALVLLGTLIPPAHAKYSLDPLVTFIEILKFRSCLVYKMDYWKVT